MLRRLQSFAFRDSPYERPNQDWVCGHAAEGDACALGPDGNGECRIVAECTPRHDAEQARYGCGRAPQHGGRCDEGPGPDGGCGRTLVKCQPVRSLGAKRRVAVRWALTLAIGILLLGTGGELGARFVLSGDLTFQHGDIAECTGCHGVGEHGAVGWLVSALRPDSGIDDSGRCLECHRLGDGALLAHSLPAGELGEAEPVAGATPSMMLRLAKLVGPPPAPSEALPCGSCHLEHNGRHFDLTAMSNQRCQACHTNQFASLAEGHPELEGFPYRRRTRIAFNHASHIGKHFAKDPEIAAPTSCTECHLPDASGRAMLVKPFDVSCASCHLGQILGEGRAGAKGYAMLNLPGFDMETLYERGISVGEWPRFADGPPTPFMSLLLASDPQHVEDMFTLIGTDLMDLRGAGEAELAAVERVIWAIKQLIHDLVVHGHAAFTERVSKALSVTVAARDVGPLMGTIPADAVFSAQEDWLPSLASEIDLHSRGEPVPPAQWWLEKTAPVPEAAPVPGAETDDDLLGGDDLLDDGGADLLGGDDMLGGDDLLGGDDDMLGGGDDLLADDDDLFGDDDMLGGGDLFGDDDVTVETLEEPAPQAEALMVPMEMEEWARAGGWYRRDTALFYRPIGHQDPLLRAWINLTAAVGPSPGASQALQIFAELTGRRAAGQCGKCHSVDAMEDGTLVVNWRPKLRTTETERFTKYQHLPHFSLLDETGCLTCHVVDYEADFMAAFSDLDPQTFAPNFKPMPKRICAACHLEESAGDACTDCHNYHIGRFPPALTAAPLALTSLGKPAPD